MQKPAVFIVPVLLALLTACSDTPVAEVKKAPEKVEPVTGLTALFRMYQSARTWAPDAQILKLSSLRISDGPEGPRGSGAMGAWEATFVSETKSQSRTYTYSVVESEGNLHKGAFAGQSESWSGQHGVTSPFLMAAVKVDCDAAFKTALEKAAEYDRKNAKMPIFYMLERTNKHPDPAWRIVWGESVATSGMSVLVDASTGSYLETIH